MQVFAAALAIIAIILFVSDYMSHRPEHRFVSLGLALLTAAWMTQLIVLTGSHLKVN